MQALLQSLKPALQTNPQEVPLQVGVPLAGADGQAVQEVPQAAMLVFDRQTLPQMCMPVGQVMPPQTEVLAIQAPLQSLKPALQTNPQEVPLQVAVPLVREGHAMQEVPQ